MIAPEISIKRALIFSLCLHAVLFAITGPRFKRKTIRYWMSVPVELVTLPSRETATVKPAEPNKPLPEPKKTAEIKKAPEKKAELKKEVITVKPKNKVAEPKPEAKAAPQPAPVPAAPVKTQSTAIVPDVNDFPFLYYLNIIQKKVTANWNFDYEGSVHQKVVVFFKIDKTGQIYDQKVENSSGIAFLDQSAVRAVLLSSPFPPLPDEYSGSFLGVHFGFEFKKEG